MKQYIIEKQLSLNQIRSIYKSYLLNDKKWFFSIYGLKRKGQTKIRVSKRVPKLESYLREKNYGFTFISYDQLDECGVIIGKYFDIFVEIWHGMTLLILNLKNEKEYKAGFERISHLYFNMIGTSMFEEAAEYAQLAIQRSYLTGYYSIPKNANNKVTHT